MLAVSSAGAAVVWNFNPNNLHAPVGSDTLVLTSEGFQITARGYTRTGAGDYVGAELFFKNRPPDGGANELGLGLVGSPFNEFNWGDPLPNFLQLDLSSILALGFTDGMIRVTSLQEGEGFQLFGSNQQGVLGTALGGPVFGLTFDDQFVSVPDFGMFQFISIVGAAPGSNVLPVAFSAVPEMSTVLPLIGLFVAVISTSVLRRRRAAQLSV
ncbi:MAG: hypothetical protein H0V56_11410 [Chthoniobacterales bacterium]|nr:hypothetical protein [Chthoniobacterales bacterium]